MRALQLGQIGGLQAPTLSMQTGLIPATSAQQFDINSIMNMMLIIVVMVMMMKMMGKVTEGA